MHMSFKSVCNKELKGVICNTTSLNNSSQSTCPVGRVLGEELLVFLDFTRNYEQTSGIFVLCVCKGYQQMTLGGKELNENR